MVRCKKCKWFEKGTDKSCGSCMREAPYMIYIVRNGWSCPYATQKEIVLPGVSNNA